MFADFTCLTEIIMYKYLNQKKATCIAKKMKMIGLQMNCKIIEHNILVAINCSDMNIETYINIQQQHQSHTRVTYILLSIHSSEKED